MRVLQITSLAYDMATMMIIMSSQTRTSSNSKLTWTAAIVVIVWWLAFQYIFLLWENKNNKTFTSLLSPSRTTYEVWWRRWFLHLESSYIPWAIWEAMVAWDDRFSLNIYFMSALNSIWLQYKIPWVTHYTYAICVYYISSTFALTRSPKFSQIVSRPLYGLDRDDVSETKERRTAARATTKRMHSKCRKRFSLR